jgi:hypothetical protein
MEGAGAHPHQLLRGGHKDGPSENLLNFVRTGIRGPEVERQVRHWHLLFVHTMELEQSASELHWTHPTVALHTWPVAEQSVAAPATQALAVQVLAAVSTVPLHDAGAQSAFDAHWTQPTLASHTGVAPPHGVRTPAVHTFPVQLGAATMAVPTQPVSPVQLLAD